MAGTWSHDWHGDVLVIKTAGSMSYAEAAACTAATVRHLEQAPARFAVMAD